MKIFHKKSQKVTKKVARFDIYCNCETNKTRAIACLDAVLKTLQASVKQKASCGNEVRLTRKDICWEDIASQRPRELIQIYFILLLYVGLLVPKQCFIYAKPKRKKKRPHTQMSNLLYPKNQLILRKFVVGNNV